VTHREANRCVECTWPFELFGAYLEWLKPCSPDFQVCCGDAQVLCCGVSCFKSVITSILSFYAKRVPLKLD
jgi:hypothetical protein